MNPIRSLLPLLPTFWQQELKRIRYRIQIRNQSFLTKEPEFLILDQFIKPGDWVIDIGANVGHYTMKFSELVGSHGRVISIEPVPETFALLAANVSLSQYSNVTLLNVAASDISSTVSIDIPDSESGLKNYYQAMITTHESGLKVMSVAMDSLAITHRVSLIKIDAEGHDPLVLRGLQKLLLRDYPVLIVETCSTSVVSHLESFGYKSEKLPGSPNLVFRCVHENTSTI